MKWKFSKVREEMEKKFDIISKYMMENIIKNVLVSLLINYFNEVVWKCLMIFFLKSFLFGFLIGWFWDILLVIIIWCLIV